MFGITRDDRLPEKIAFLVRNYIELHAQIVVCPGVNDGAVLEQTVSGLAHYFPGVRSVAVVPVGLTKHREGLEKIEPVTPDYARKMTEDIHRLQKHFLEYSGERFVYLSDEWYLSSGRTLPPLSHYGDLFQIENGVISEHVVPVLAQSEGLDVSAVGVVNEFYGPGVSVSGLLSGRDFVREIEKEDADLFLLPPDCLNQDGLTLDDMTVDSMMKATGKKILKYEDSLMDVWTALDAA